MTVEQDPEVQSVYPTRRGAKVKIYLKDGRELAAEVYDLKGSPNNPVGFEEIKNKFVANVKNLLTAEDLESLLDMVMNLEKLESVEPLMAILTKELAK